MRKHVALFFVLMLVMTGLPAYAEAQEEVVAIAFGKVSDAHPNAIVRSEAKESASAIGSFPAGTSLYIADFVPDEDGDKYVWACLELNDGNLG